MRGNSFRTVYPVFVKSVCTFQQSLRELSNQAIENSKIKSKFYRLN